ncbi:MAG: tRNA lysidine(34) synthetase TilS [Gammaproteobacteria bacterium]|nr:tRNA lysidine(34) synthetase TilS [Gammaproteobacteria bacterium]
MMNNSAVSTTLKSSQLLKSAITHFIRQVSVGTPVKVAFSGGLDSTVLLHLLAQHAEFQGILSAHYIDHGLQSDSAEWAQHCQRQCVRINVAFSTTAIDLSCDQANGVEFAARKLRYAALTEGLSADAILVTGHHQRDQAETVLLNLVRGAGVSGGAGIPYRRSLAVMPLDNLAGELAVDLVRPLLNVPYACLQAYAKAHCLEWIDDPSNEDHRYRRNYVRHAVLPVLKRVWPQAERSLAKVAKNLAEAHDLLDRLAQIDLADQSKLPLYLNLQPLTILDWPAIKNCIRYWMFHKFGLQLSGKHYEWIHSVVSVEGVSKQCAFSYQLAQGMLRFDGMRLAYLRRALLPYDYPLDKVKGACLEAGVAREFKVCIPVFEIFNSSLFRVRNLSQEDDIKRKSLKKFFQKNDIPVWERQVWPVLTYQGRLISVLGCTRCLFLGEGVDMKVLMTLSRADVSALIGVDVRT